MDSFRDDLKVDVKPNLTKNVKLIMQYIEKEKEIQRQFDEEDGIDVNSPNYEPDCTMIIAYLNDFAEYKKVRTEEYYKTLAMGKHRSRENAQELSDMSKRRSYYHNHALHALNSMNKFAIRFGLEPIYTDEALTDEDIKTHNNAKYELRKKMTDKFLEIINDIELSTWGIRDGAKKELNKLQLELAKLQRDYGVIKGLTEDDGDIQFKDFQNEIQH